MIYLLSQMSIIILLAALAGGAIGWVLQRLQGQQRTNDLHRVITQQQQQVKQAQTEVSMVAQDYDELKQSSSSTIDNLRQDNEQIPNLHQNLEKSQLLVRQLMQKHEAQIREYASENEVLKGKVKHLDDRERALNILQADVEQGRREINNARKDATTSERTEKSTETTAAATSTGTPSLDASFNPSLDKASDKTTAKRSSESSTDSSTNPSTDSSTNPSTDSSNSSSWASSSATTDTSSASPLSRAGVVPVTSTGARAHTNTTSQSIADLTEIARQRAEQERSDGLDMSADVSGEAGSLTVALAEADVVLAAIDKKREDPQQTIADDEVIDASEIDFDMEFDEDGLNSAEQLFDPVDQHDDLQTIFGIGPMTERGLNRLGITSYSQLADLKRHDVERIANALEIVPGKIERENWVGNARRQLEDVLEEL